MARTTKVQLYDEVDKINRGLEHLGKTSRLRLNGVMGQFRVDIATTGKFGCSNSHLSPRLPRGELLRWLEAFWKGMVIE